MNSIATQELDRRTVQRQRVLYAGKVVYLGYAVQVDCTIRNMSDGGAKIYIPSDVSAIPSEFYLLDVGRQTIVRAQVSWKRDHLFGLKFSGEREYVADSKDPLVRRLRNL